MLQTSILPQTVLQLEKKKKTKKHGLPSIFKIADPDQGQNAQIGSRHP